MTFLEITAANMVSMFIFIIFIITEAIILIGKPAGGGHRYWIRVIGVICLFIIGCSLFGAAMLKLGWMYIPYLSDSLLHYCQLAAGTLLLIALYDMKKKTCWFTMLIISVTANMGNYMGLLLMPDRAIHLAVMQERLLYMFVLWVAVPICLILILIVLYKTGAGRHYQQWLDYGIIRNDMLILMSCYPPLFVFVQRMIERFESDNSGNLMISILLLMLTYIFFVYISRQDMQKHQIEAQQVSLQQQTAYIENLESLQQEARRFRHDFKNMMSGMYLQTKDGDTAAVQSYIQDMAADFDVHIGKQLKLMNQLANIHHLAIKSLILAKLDEMKRAGIYCNLEVFRAFDQTRLRDTDLCRCLGILIDNAIEAVQDHPDGQIHILISRQENYTTFLVKNTLYETVDFHKIGTAGYSTKGENRGIGLNNYHQILRQYDFVLPLTTIKDGYFIQELKIEEA